MTEGDAKPVRSGRCKSFGYRYGPALLLAILVPILLVVLERPIGSDPFVVLFSPWVGMGEAFDRVDAAGGLVLQEGGMPGVFIVQAENDSMGPDHFLGALSDQGAWLKLGTRAVTWCAPPKPMS